MPVLNLTADKSGVRLDRYLADEIEIVSRSKIKRVIESRGVLVNGREVKPSFVLEGGEVILVDLPEGRRPSVGGEDIPLDIIHEDRDLIVVNKPAGLVVHPGAGNRNGTLVNSLVYHFDTLSQGTGPQRPGIVHRLDKNTSGVLVVAKTDSAHMFLARQFARRKVEKTYLALVWGRLDPKEGTVDEPLARHPFNRKKYTCSKDGRPAVTRYGTRKEFDELTLVDLFPLTGRTHQLRVHMSWIGHPILGDSDYGGARKGKEMIGRQALHANHLTFVHPETRKNVSFSAPLPDDFQSVLEELESVGT